MGEEPVTEATYEFPLGVELAEHGHRASKEEDVPTCISRNGGRLTLLGPSRKLEEIWNKIVSELRHGRKLSSLRIR